MISKKETEVKIYFSLSNMYFQPHQSNRNEFFFFDSSKESDSSKFNETSDFFSGLVRSTKEMQNRILAIWRDYSSKKTIKKINQSFSNKRLLL